MAKKLKTQVIKKTQTLIDKKNMNLCNDVQMRLMKEEDLNLLIKTFDFPWNTMQITNEKWQRYYDEQQKGTRNVYLVEYRHQLVGYGSLLYFSEYPEFKQANIPEIHDVWISQEMRNKGLGTKLILHLEEVAKKEGYHRLGIGVGLYRDYGPAQILYYNLGYLPDGKGITYKDRPVVPGETYPVDDDLILWLHKLL